MKSNSATVSSALFATPLYASFPPSVQFLNFSVWLRGHLYPTRGLSARQTGLPPLSLKLYKKRPLALELKHYLAVEGQILVW